MSDLIRREDAIHILACEMYAEAQAEGYEVGSVEDYIPEAKAWMSDAPSADAVEVVRCRECKDFRPNAEQDSERCRYHWIYVDGEDFCSYGERKGGEDE